jgi:hypothetical protein
MRLTTVLLASLTHAEKLGQIQKLCSRLQKSNDFRNLSVKYLNKHRSLNLLGYVLKIISFHTFKHTDT